MKQKDMRQMQTFLRSIGKCGSVSSNRHLCTITENHVGRMHVAQILGGVDDGLELEKWEW